MSEQNNFDLIRGTAPTLRFQIINPELIDGNVTSWTTLFTLKKTVNDNTAILTANGAIAEVEAADFYGIFDVALTANQTLSLTENAKYVYSFRRTNVGFEDVLTFGEITARTVA